MDRIARLLVTHHRRVIVATVLLTLLAVAMFYRMSFNADVASFVMEDNEAGEAFAALQGKYETADPINLLLTTQESSFADGRTLADLREFRLELEEIDGVASVATVLPEDEALLELLALAQMRMAQGPQPLTVDDIPETLASLPPIAVREGLLSTPLAELLISPDKTGTLVMIVPEEAGFGPVRDLKEYVDGDTPGDFEVTMSGNPVIWDTVWGMMSWFLLVIPPVVVGLLLATFYANIGDRKLTIIAVIPAVMGSLWTFGVLFGLGVKVDIVTLLVPIYVIVMGSADGLHFVSHFQEEVARTEDPYERVGTTLRQVGVPMILTTISTAAGFLSLLVADVRPIQQLGVFTAMGIAFAGVISFFFLPALLSHMKVESKAHHALLGPRVTRGIKVLAKRRWVAAALSLALAVFAAVGITMLEVDSDQLFMFKEDHQIRQDFMKMEEALGGATPLIGEFTFDPDADPAGEIDRVLAASKELEALPGVRRVFSVADIAALLAEQAPERVDAALAGEVATPLGDMVSDDGLRFVLFPGEFQTEDLRGWLDYAEESPDVRIITGMPVLWDEIARLVLRAQVGSLVAAFALVALMLALAYRRVRETLVSLLPLALTVGTLLGFIAISGIQLNLVTAIISAIVLGVGIDYAIHFVAAIDHARADGPGYVLRAIDKAGRPIVANALGIAVGLTGLWLSPFDIHGNISMIMWVSMTTACLTALLVISALSRRDGMQET